MPGPLSRCLLAVCLFGLGLVLHWPGLDRPFGVHDINPGCFFGVWARNWDRFGFTELRGLPLGSQLLDAVAEGDPDTNHPPLFGWLCYWSGLAEAQLRLPTVVGHALSAALLFLLLVGPFGAAAAFVGGLTLLATPALAFYSQVSFECVVLPVTLLLWLVCSRGRDPAGGARGRRAALAACLAFVALWLDWLAAFQIAAIVPLLAERRVAPTMRRVAMPFAATLLAAVTIFAWRAWALAHPAVHALPTGAGETLPALVDRTFLQRPALFDFLRQVGGQLRAGFTAPLLIAGAIGFVPLASRAPRLALATLLGAAVIPLLFAHHASTHVQFVSYFAPLLAAGLAALCRLHRLLLVAGIVVTAWVAQSAVAQITAAATPFFREFGRALSDAARQRAPERSPGRNFVAFNFVYRYGYYVDTSDVFKQPVIDPLLLARTEALQGLGLRYLYLRMEGSAVAKMPALAPNPALETYLAGFPRQRLPQLETEIVVPPDGYRLRVTEAWVHTLVP